MRSRPITPLLALVLLLGGACSGSDGEEKAKSTTTAKPTTTLPPKSPAPLTGALVEPELAARPAVSIKVNNTKDGGLQAGLEQADVIYEERVEGGLTRLIAIYQSEDSDLVGPIRSIRPTDPVLVWPFGGVFAFSDGVPQVVRQMEGVPVEPVFEMEGAAPFIYPRDRSRPYKTFAATARLRQEASAAGPPPAFATFGTVPESAGTPVTSASVTFGPRSVSGFEWDPSSDRWLKIRNGAPHTVSSGARLGFHSVIVQFVNYKSAGYRDITGSTVDQATLTGTGDGVLFVKGRQIPIKWSKAANGQMTKYTDVAGKPVVLPVGRTLVMLPGIGSPLNVVAPAPPTSTTAPARP